MPPCRHGYRLHRIGGTARESSAASALDKRRRRAPDRSIRWILSPRAVPAIAPASPPPPLLRSSTFVVRQVPSAGSTSSGAHGGSVLSDSRSGGLLTSGVCGLPFGPSHFFEEPLPPTFSVAKLLGMLAPLVGEPLLKIQAAEGPGFVHGSDVGSAADLTPPLTPRVVWRKRWGSSAATPRSEGAARHSANRRRSRPRS